MTRLRRPKALLSNLVLISLLFPPIAPRATAATAPALRGSPVAGLLSAQAIVFNPASGKIYAVDSVHGSVAVVDKKTGLRHEIRTGDAPVAIAINSSTNRVYVANNGSGTISVVDGDTDAITATIEIGKTPFVLAVNNVTGEVYVSNTFNSSLSVIDGRSNNVHQIKAGSVNKILVDEQRNLIYLLGYEDDFVTVLDGKTMSLRRLPVGAMHLWDIALDASTGEAFVARIENHDLLSIHATLGESSSFPVGNMPCAVRIDAGRARIYAANYADNSVTVLDAATRKPIATIPVGQRPQAIAVDEPSNLIFVANTHSSTISVIDGVSLKVIATLPAGKNPFALAVDVPGGTVYAADLSKQGFAQIDIGRVVGPARRAPR